MQTSAPLPQDVHPQAYQANGAVGPPGPQWGASVQAQGPPSHHAAAGGHWPGRLADINPPPQPPNPYDQRDAMRGPPPPPPQGPRQPSPRPEQQMRPYQDPTRHTPIAARRGLSPPHDHRGPPPFQAQQQPAPEAPRRVMNPHFQQQQPPNALPQAPNHINGPSSGGIPPFGRGNSPRPDIRPILDNRMPSPKSGYPPHSHFQHHPDISNPGGIERGAPPPASALAAAEAAANERDDRPASVGPKRMREWEDDTSMKKPASEENRARMDDMHHRRPSTPPREPFRRSTSEARRAEDQRRANENYHPSEAAHHPQTHSLPAHLPPMQSGPGPHHDGPPAPPPQSGKDYPMEDQHERGMDHQHPPPTAVSQMSEPERAARKMEVDEDYDDDGEDEKKPGLTSASAPGSAVGEGKNTPPASGGMNGHSAGMMNGQSQPKVEAPA